MIRFFNFFIGFIKSPGNVGAIVPSSRFLAKQMAASIPANAHTIVELGAGTGAITHQLNQRPHKHLVIFELSPKFCAMLKTKFPEAIIINDSAEHLAEYAKKYHWHVDAIVSSLPMLNFPATLITGITNSAFEALQPQGQFIQFTYGKRDPLPETASWRSNCSINTSKVWLNIPPARTWRYTVNV